MRFVVLQVLFFLFSQFAFGQSRIYTSDQNRHISIIDLQAGNCLPALQVISDISLSDITLHPNGKMYGVSFSQRKVYEVSLVTGATTEILQIAEADKLVGMTAGANGLLYITEGNVIPSDLYVVDPVAGTYVNKGPLADGSAGDLTWSFGKLYNASDNNKLVEVNVDDPANSITIGNFNGIVKAGDRIFALVTVFTSCAATETYALSVFGDYYSLDLETAVVNRLCIGNIDLYGATSADEFLASECFVGIDLDEDNSSGAAASDFESSFFCETTSASLADEDALLLASTQIDSLILQILSPIPDGASEALQSGAAPNITVTNTGQRIKATNAGVASLADFETFLKAVNYTNSAFPVTAGTRNVQVVAWSEGSGDTATAFVSLASVYAGEDGAALICGEDGTASLLGFIGGDPVSTGTWSPPLASGTDLFDAAVDDEGTYAYVVTDGCSVDTAFATVTVIRDDFDVLSDTTVCGPDALTLDADIGVIGATYLWNNGATTPSITVTASGTYSVDISVNGCVFSDAAMVNFESFEVSIGQDFTLCPGDNALLDANIGDPAAQYLWSTGATSSGLLVDAGGVYSVAVTLNGCTSTDSVAVTLATGGDIAFDLGSDITICEGESATITSGFPTSVYDHTWSSGSTNNTINTSTPGLYILQLSNSCQTGIDSINVFVTDCDTVIDPVDPIDTTGVPEPVCELLVPSAFTPNGDGANDLFGPLNPCPEIEGFDFRVYNRFGEEVFRGDDQRFWNGTFKSRKVPMEIFVWYVEWTDTAGVSQRRTGTVSVLY